MASTVVYKDAPGTDVSFITWEEFTIQTTSASMSCLPDIPSCVDYLIRNIWCRSTNTSDVWIGVVPGGKAIMQMNKLQITCDIDNLITIIEWEGEQPPESFHQFKEEWNRQFDRYLKIKAFW